MEGELLLEIGKCLPLSLFCFFMAFLSSISYHGRMLCCILCPQSPRVGVHSMLELRSAWVICRDGRLELPLTPLS